MIIQSLISRDFVQLLYSYSEAFIEQKYQTFPDKKRIYIAGLFY